MMRYYWIAYAYLLMLWHRKALRNKLCGRSFGKSFSLKAAMVLELMHPQAFMVTDRTRQKLLSALMERKARKMSIYDC